jgi:hypothetical protein
MCAAVPDDHSPDLSYPIRFFTSSRFKAAIAFVGLRLFGHASTQLNIVWHLQRPCLSSSASKCSRAPSSRLSAMKRYALRNAWGPRYYSSAQKDGHDEVQEPQRMHS